MKHLWFLAIVTVSCAAVDDDESSSPGSHTEAATNPIDLVCITRTLCCDLSRTGPAGASCPPNLEAVSCRNGAAINEPPSTAYGTECCYDSDCAVYLVPRKPLNQPWERRAFGINKKLATTALDAWRSSCPTTTSTMPTVSDDGTQGTPSAYCCNFRCVTRCSGAYCIRPPSPAPPTRR